MVCMIKSERAAYSGERLASGAAELPQLPQRPLPQPFSYGDEDWFFCNSLAARRPWTFTEELPFDPYRVA